MINITGTFIDEISHDIPHQNWSPLEWEKDIQAMKKIGIDTLIIIRCGYKKFITYPSKYLQNKFDCFKPPIDLIEMFLTLAYKYQMKVFIGLYDSGYYWETGDFSKEKEANMYVIEELHNMYGHHPAFAGWYLSMEISRKSIYAIDLFNLLSKHCKSFKNIPCLISPWIDGKKSVLAHTNKLTKNDSITVELHNKEWNEIFDGIHKNIDIVAFQDGHVEIEELPSFLQINKQLADKYNLISWTNSETFDRDMPIKFLPIKFEKLLLKLQAAKNAHIDKAITFEFSHFMSPYSSYISAHHLYNRYLDYFKLN